MRCIVHIVCIVCIVYLAYIVYIVYIVYMVYSVYIVYNVYIVYIMYNGYNLYNEDTMYILRKCLQCIHCTLYIYIYIYICIYILMNTEFHQHVPLYALHVSLPLYITTPLCYPLRFSLNHPLLIKRPVYIFMKQRFGHESIHCQR